jgi:diguanylate cyclase (GGDEF)-like protein/PAS domain S-box-containing protein
VQRVSDTKGIQDVLEVVPDGVIVSERDGTIWFANQSAINMFGYATEELIGAPVEMLIPAERRAQHYQHRKRYAAMPSVRPMGQDLNLTALRRNGETFPVEISLSPIEIDGRLFVVSTLRDLTERRSIERLLQRRTIHLQLLHLTNTVANDAGSSDDAINLAIREVCKHLDFDIGHAYVTQQGDRLYAASLRSSWCIPGNVSVRDFITHSDDMIFEEGQGVPGHVIATGEPVWCYDVTTEAAYLRADVARDAGIGTGVFVPVRIRESVVAVLEFYTFERHYPDGELVEALGQIGLLLGRTVERKRSREQYIADSQFRERVLDAAGDGLLIIEPSGIVQFANTWIANAFEEPRSQLVGSHIGDIPRFASEKAFDDFPAPGHPLLKVFERGESIFNLEMRAHRPVQGPIDLSFNISPLLDDRGQVICAVLSIRDISEQRRASALVTSQSDVLEAVARGVPLSDVARRLVEHIEHHVDSVHVAILVASSEDSQVLELLSAPSLQPRLVQGLMRVDISGSSRTCARAAKKSELVIEFSGQNHEDRDTERRFEPRSGIQAEWAFPILTSTGRLLGIINVYSDRQRSPDDRDREILTHAAGLAQIAIERDNFERQLARQAFYDELTGLPKRALLMDRIHHAQQRALRSGNDVAVLFVDLDEFKSVNDSLGHQAGDELLRQAASRLTRSVRAEDTVVRFAGDEFVIVLEDITSDEDVEAVVDRIQQSFKTPLPVDGIDVFASCSIGVARHQADDIDAEGLLRRADHAMYRAKELGRGHAAVFSAEIDDWRMSPLELESHLRVAVASEAFELVYQPVLDLQNGEVFAFETLIRWFDDELGEVPPDTFLPVASELGLMPQITRWVFLQSSRQLAEWRETYQKDLRLMINISPSELLSDDVLAMVSEAIQDGMLPPDRIILELTEQAMIDTSSMAGDTLYRLRQMRVELALDDFGTGYSSLSYLHQFPVTYIKLDRSFLTGAESSTTSPAVIAGIVEIAQKLGIKVIAEGVESIANQQFSRSIGCDLAQGYFYAPPHPASRAVLILDE